MNINSFPMWAEAQWRVVDLITRALRVFENCHSELVSESWCEILRNSDAEIISARQILVIQQSLKTGVRT